MIAPQVRYAQNAGVSIAYQVLGDGPRDVLLVCGTMSHLASLDGPTLARWSPTPR